MTDQDDHSAPAGTAFTPPGHSEREAILRDRLIQTELRAAARDAGMHDLDGLKLLDQSGLALDDRMELPAAAALIAGLKRDKPYLFGMRAGGTTAPPPPAVPGRGRNAMEMSLEEWRSARADLLRRR